MCILDIGTLGGRDVLDLCLCASGFVGGGLLLLPTLSHTPQEDCWFVYLCIFIVFFSRYCVGFFSFFVLFLQVQQSVIHYVFLFVSIFLFYFSLFFFCLSVLYYTYTVITHITLKTLFHYTSFSCRLLVGCVLHGFPVLCHIMQSPKLLLKYTSVNRNKQIQMCQIVVNSFIM